MLVIYGRMLASASPSCLTATPTPSGFHTARHNFPIKRLIRPSERLLSRLSGFLIDAFWLGRGARFIQVKCKTSILASVVKFVEYQPMDVESLKKQVQLMRVLVAGCKKHPPARAASPFIMQLERAEEDC